MQTDEQTDLEKALNDKDAQFLTFSKNLFQFFTAHKSAIESKLNNEEFVSLLRTAIVSSVENKLIFTNVENCPYIKEQQTINKPISQQKLNLPVQ